ncbi:unnamed protein product [Brugia timori]|uniref:Uncharacterized protein n=1 Tax=Brugia timori TaxID=42155 RepID=A0A0R3QI05_9BILA|nr:unnamed protein product [Brugia timori]
MTVALYPISGTLVGCIGCMYFVESIAKEQPSSMNLMTFSTFLFISLEGLIFTSKFFAVPNKIPIRSFKYELSVVIAEVNQFIGCSFNTSLIVFQWLSANSNNILLC